MAYQDRYRVFADKKILIYGTGKYAERCIEQLKNYNIVGIVDRVRYWGNFCGYPIVLWDDIREESADIIIIAVRKKNIPAVYDRIFDRCIMCHIAIYDSGGLNLLQYWGVPRNYYRDEGVFSVNQAELKREIESHEAISFDVFDTLIMRRVLEPSDLFDLVEYRAKKREVCVLDFKKIRREAELRAGDKNLYEIYHILESEFGLTDRECQILLQEELLAEEVCILPRDRVIDCMRYALELGKRVTLISDMYLPADIMKKFFKKAGITGYENLYISCEYGCGKGNGLFDVYKRNVPAKNYLHIGDNASSDGEGAKKSGMDYFWIPGAYDMLRASSLRPLVSYAGSYNEKALLGMLAAELFSAPFALYHKAGNIRIESRKVLGKLLLSPLVLLYMQNLEAALQRAEYKGVLFAARDGYLFDKLYRLMGESGKFNIFHRIPPYYIATSRKLCTRAAMRGVENIDIIPELNAEKLDGKTVLRDMLGMQEGLTDLKSGQSEKEYYRENKDIILNTSYTVRERYYRYFEKKGIRMDERYLYCDLNSTGTSQYGLSQMFQAPLDGYYLIRYRGATSFSYPCYASYEIDVTYPEYNSFMDKTNLLEVILSSPEPSVVDLDENAVPIYAAEKRSAAEIRFMEDVQSGIMEFFKDFIKELYIPGVAVKREFAERAYRLCEEVEYAGECSIIKAGSIYDDFMEMYRTLF